ETLQRSKRLPLRKRNYVQLHPTLRPIFRLLPIWKRSPCPADRARVTRKVFVWLESNYSYGPRKFRFVCIKISVHHGVEAVQRKRLDKVLGAPDGKCFHLSSRFRVT